MLGYLVILSTTSIKRGTYTSPSNSERTSLIRTLIRAPFLKYLNNTQLAPLCQKTKKKKRKETSAFGRSLPGRAMKIKRLWK